MTFLKYSAFVLVLLCTVTVLVIGFIGRKPIRSILLNTVLGIAALVLVKLTTRFTGVDIPVNEWTVGGSTVFGISGVCGLLLLKLIFGV